jgi:hypothetical protein
LDRSNADLHRMLRIGLCTLDEYCVVGEVKRGHP